MTAKKKILIVDDDRQICEMLKTILQRKGYEAYALFDGINIIDSVKGADPDVIFLDVSFPTGPDGIEICKTLKGDELTKAIPLIMMTATEDIESVDKCFALGVEDYIFKPFNLEDFLLRIKKHEKKRRP